MLPDQLVQSNNVVVAGDFNIHINKQVENDEAGIFVSTLELMGLVIHQLEETHKSGNILHLILTVQVQTHVENNQKDAITNMVNDCGRNSKKLYTFVTNLTGTFKENPLPEDLPNRELAEQFAEFFLTKIRRLDRTLMKKESTVQAVMVILPTLSLNLTDSWKRKWQA